MEDGILKLLCTKKKTGCEYYGKKEMKFYDWLVLKFSNSIIWKCATEILVNFYQKNLKLDGSKKNLNHLEVAVGTGKILHDALEKYQKLFENPRVEILDASPHSLKKSREKLGKIFPEIISHQKNILKKIGIKKKFDSIGCNFFLHCLRKKDKKTALENLSKLLKKNGKIFGSTILGKKYSPNFGARIFSEIYNLNFVGTFDNSADDEKWLENLLLEFFEKVEIKIVGQVAMFSATGVRNFDE